MSEKPIIVVGHAALDRVYRIAEFPARPTKVRALEHIECGGGMAANAAVAIARLGSAVELWSRTGEDEAGARIRTLLATEGVDVTFVMRHRGARSSTSAILVDSRGERLVVSERDHAMPMDAAWLPVQHIANAAAVLSDGNWLEGTVAAFDAARETGVVTVLDADTGSGPVLDRIMHLANYAILSAPALEEYLPGLDLGDQLERVVERGPRHAGVTKGSRGYHWHTREGATGSQPAFSVRCVDTTGAGDAFHGAFTWALSRNCDDAGCALIASAVAALKCEKLGARAGLPTAQVLDAFLIEQTDLGLSEIPAR